MKNKQPKQPKLPELLERKIYKTGQTRGADDDVIYQNRVGRNSTVLIPYELWDMNHHYINNTKFEKGFICLISPKDYFETENIHKILENKGLIIGTNTLVFYQKRHDWNKYPPLKDWREASSRIAPLNGHFVARIAATTAIERGAKINRGFTTTGMKGAGIRLFEYASLENITKCRIQLEAIYWLCKDSVHYACEFGMKKEDAEKRKSSILKIAEDNELLDFTLLKTFRIIDKENNSICPLCLEKISAAGFFNKLAQAEGREVHDLTITEINLFHIKELRYGEFNHRPYNLGWGHHHCNVVVKDSGIAETLQWMESVINRNNELKNLK